MCNFGFTTVHAQVRVGINGNVSVGSTNIPTEHQTKFHVVGNSVFLGTNTYPISAPYIRGKSVFSNPTTPDFTWYGSDQTGIYHPNHQTIGFSSSGQKIIEISDLNATAGNAFTTEIYSNNRNLLVKSNHSGDYNFGILSSVNRRLSKAIAVEFDKPDGTKENNFYVQGDGLCAQKRYDYVWSDSAYKTDIIPIQNALATVKNLKGVKFHYKPETGQAPPSNYTLGFVAQDVLPFVPEVVEYNTETKYMLSYEQMVPLLTEAIKEQNTQFTTLQNQYNLLQLKVDSLQNCCKKKNGNNGNGNANKTAPTDNCETCDLLQSKAELFQNRPNPFNKESIIEYYLPENQTGKMMLFDMTGKLIKSINLTKTGKANLVIQAQELGAGMYIYSLVVNDQEVDSKRMIITD